MKPGQRETIPRAVCGNRVDFFVPANNRVPSIYFAESPTKIPNQFVKCFVLRFSRQIPVEIAYKANADRNIVQIIAVYMSAAELPVPAIADFDLAVFGGCAVADDKMVSEPVWHVADITVVVIKDPGISLSSSAVVDDNVFPPVASDARIIDGRANSRSQVLPGDASSPGSRDEVSLIFSPRLLYHDRIVFVIISFTEEKPVMLTFGDWCGSCNVFNQRGGCDLGGRRLRACRRRGSRFFALHVRHRLRRS